MSKLDILEKSPLQQMKSAFDSKLALQYFCLLFSSERLNGKVYIPGERGIGIALTGMKPLDGFKMK
ncbi:hypothetical protein [Evansella clarkii]|uniref:hypothetical protein n=1 Tax=Evansella clarkii TaxID=79879 RepID=UPI000996BAB7|nr:hypothetical protein [Evansella clarkii]